MNKALVRRATKVSAPRFVQYYEMVAKNPKCINDFIVYEGERSLLSITSDLELIKHLIGLGADINALAFSNYNKKHCTDVFQYPPSNLWYMLAVARWHTDVIAYFFNNFNIQAKGHIEASMCVSALKTNNTLGEYVQSCGGILSTYKIGYNKII